MTNNPPTAICQRETIADNSVLTQQKSHPTNSVVCNVLDIQKMAKEILPRPLYEYLASGTDSEQTLTENIHSFQLWYLRPRMMRPVSNVSTETYLLGQRLSMPLFVSPAGVQALCDTIHGECATARACGHIGTLFGLSQHATRSIEDVATAAPNTNKWYQSYILKDRALTLRLIHRAVHAGYKGIFLTVDSVRFGFREADKRNGFNALPPPHRLVNYDEEQLTGGGGERAFSSLDETYNGKKYESWDQNSELMFETNLTWDDVRWLKREGCLGLPLIVKGIMTGEDAILALDAGADGILVSNHGGRQLDGALSSIDALPEIVRAVNGRAPVLLDGGIRRGTDILKALALGATAVGIGKPVFFSLAVGGEEWVIKMMKMFQTELESAMALCGCETVTEISSNLVCRHPVRSTYSSNNDRPHTIPYVRSAL